MESLLQLMRSHVDFNDSIICDLAQKVVKRKLNRRKFILTPDSQQESLLFLTTGITRNFYRADTKEWTSRFSQPGDFILSVDSFIFDKPSKEYIETCTAIEFWEISKLDYLDLITRHHELHILTKKLSDHHLQLGINRMYNWRMLSPLQRYELFLSENPNLIMQVQGQHIASYLGVTSFDLSRIRRRFKELKASVTFFGIIDISEMYLVMSGLF
ncbi:hypothetical protein DSL64_15480 [Dyadobacter luteus]|uniref:Crp/Fnr family transcriptional regulator n=1 Tax=Dyadobacter luteus TaxID=2259619 RepID=A0A3D8YCN6_9BACT|nr:Crp/Fnr family transcriptional regulator [Dyadobacter luteus]REA60081.1 hypothetical protein DSL64_15480 [Dyadobacter luteus]